MITTIPSLPFSKRLKFRAVVMAIQTFLVAPTLFIREVMASLRPAATAPDLVKTYPCRRRLPNRIFFPKTYDRTNPASPPLPVLFTIHGGGFILGSPPDNDGWNSAFASQHDVLVVALNYGKAPANAFPGPINDVEALLLAVLSDSSLPIDRSRVAVAGWSAGGNLALAVCQREEIRPIVKAVVALYPVGDYTLPTEKKVQGRRYKPSLGGFRAREKDYFVGMSELATWAYCPVGHDAKDPELSVCLAGREALPPNVFVVGCEMDFLADRKSVV